MWAVTFATDERDCVTSVKANKTQVMSVCAGHDMRFGDFYIDKRDCVNFVKANKIQVVSVCAGHETRIGDICHRHCNMLCYS